LRLYIALSALKDLGKSLAELKVAVDGIFNHPIKGFGVLTDYAERRLTQATGVGRDKILVPLPPPLREAAGIYEHYTVALAKASEGLLRRFGRSIADQQYALKRVADVAIDLFVGLCVLSRAAAIASESGKAGEVVEPGEAAGQAIQVARTFAQQAKRRMAHQIRRLERNEDQEMDRLAEFILDKGAYPWDVFS
jgi:hypothetical protein